MNDTQEAEVNSVEELWKALRATIEKHKLDNQLLDNVSVMTALSLLLAECLVDAYGNKYSRGQALNVLTIKMHELLLLGKEG